MFRYHFAIFGNNIEMCKIDTFKCLNLISTLFQTVKIVMMGWIIFQYLAEMLQQYFNCNEILELSLTRFCNILCYVGT